MKPNMFLTLLLAVSSTVWVISSQSNTRNLLQFWQIIKCTIPDSNPLEDFNEYGCYCGFGGFGTPMDDLDMCCKIHDDCYGASKTDGGCKFIFDNPYTETYSYSCTDNEVTCSSENNSCKMHICECDREAALCFSESSYNETFRNLNKDEHCK